MTRREIHDVGLRQARVLLGPCDHRVEERLPKLDRALTIYASRHHSDDKHAVRLQKDLFAPMGIYRLSR
jgi:hypothetical protein